MSEPVKKVGPAPASGAEKDGKIGLEKTMLLNLQKMKESASGVMKAEDLEYPDVASLTSTAPQTSEASQTCLLTSPHKTMCMQPSVPV